MTGHLALQERAQQAARYEVWKSVVRVQRWWRANKGRYAQVDAKTIKNCHAKLIATWSVADTQRRGRRSNSRGLDVVQVVQEMFTRSPKNSIWQTRRESWLSFHCAQYVLKYEPKWRAWKPHYCQSLSAEDCYICEEFWDVMSAWHRHWSDLWSDEAVFQIGGHMNRHNCHYLAGDDSRITSGNM